MLFHTLGSAGRCIAATEHGGVNEEIGQEWCAGRVRHGLQSAWPKQWGLRGCGSIRAQGVTGSLGASGITKPSMSRVEADDRSAVWSTAKAYWISNLATRSSTSLRPAPDLLRRQEVRVLRPDAERVQRGTCSAAALP